MTWARFGDTSATHPRVMAVEETAGADERSRLEVFGFVACAATLSGAHNTDYEVSLGTARLLAGTRTQLLLDQATEAGLLTARKRSGRVRYFIVQDPEFIHLRLASEIAWEKRRKADTTNPSLIGPVRLRDGDACRYCGQVVNWEARTGPRYGTYDHRTPGRGAEKPDDLVVACGRCNKRRSNDPDADLSVPLLPVPPDPYYSDRTAQFLEDLGYRPSSAATKDLRPAERGDATVQPAGQRPRPLREEDAAATPRRSAVPRPADTAVPAGPTEDTPAAPEGARKRSRRRRSAGRPPGGDTDARR